MTVIIDTSPLISFAIINQLELLEKLFHTIIVPQSVSEEIAREKNREENVRVSNFLKNRVAYPKKQNKLKAKLGKGETEAIHLPIKSFLFSFFSAISVTCTYLLRVLSGKKGER